jgi:hypothetical protein
LGAIYAWLPPLVGLGIILWRNRGHLSIRNNRRFLLRPLNRVNLLTFAWADIAFIGIFALIVFTRFWAIRSLEAPQWADSYQHTMMTQLLVDHGGLFNSWQPYAEMTTFTYHFGFHTASAVFEWITHVDTSTAVLWVGQLLNVLAVITLYPLAKKVGGSKWAGVAAVLVAGLLSPMPMYYVNWGRYTQLAGQVILPGAIYLAWITLEAGQNKSELPILAEESKWSKWRRRIPFGDGQTALTCLILGGLMLTHYLVAIFAGVFIVAFFLLNIQKGKIRNLIFNITFLFVGIGVLVLPWFIHVFLGKLTNILAYYVTTPTKAASTFVQDFNAIGDISSYLPILVWLLLVLCIAWGFWRHEKGVALMGVWWFLNFLATNPQWLDLPGEGVITNFTLFIALYIPAGVLIGAGFGWFQQSFIETFAAKHSQRYAWVYSFLLLIIMGGIGLWGVDQRQRDLAQLSSSLVTRPDKLAAEWIQENTPQDARFLINSLFSYGDTLIMGSDGGWWLPLLAGRQTTVPPLPYGSEQGPRADYIPWINTLTTEIQDKGISNPDVLALLHKRGIGYVYLGQQQGRVSYNGPYVLKPDELLSSPFFHLIYHQDRVWIFEVVS